MKPHRLLLIALLYWLVAGLWLVLAYTRSGISRAQTSGTVAGQVVDATGPLPGALVRVRATDHVTTTRADGTFTLDVPGEGPFVITAWVDAYFVGWAENVQTGAEDVLITLRPYYTTDNPDYPWFSTEDAEGSLSCQHCMPCYEEWIVDAHSQSAVNPRYLTLYNGTDVAGNQSPPTRYATSRDYGRFPLPPDLEQPYYGPGYRLDFPDSAGNCGTCHTPAAAAYPGRAYSADPNTLTGIEAEGVFCEFCHKIGSVTLDPVTGLPYANMPGVLSMQLFRPAGEDQLFFGNFDDVTRRVSYLPLMEESAFCAPCHFGMFWDTVIYNSYGEWLDSPYSDPVTGQTCQDCHMPTVDYDYITYPEQGGFIRDRSRIYSHLMPGAADEAMLHNTAELTLTAQRDGDQIIVAASVFNATAGHHIPTDSPLRQILLVITATDSRGEPLALASGPVQPDWAGDLAGWPGVYYAKILQDVWTEITPSSAYWNPTRIVEDTRLPALATDTSTYAFALPADDATSGSAITVEARLIFRRAFYDLMQQKGWDQPDIVMAQVTITVE